MPLIHDNNPKYQHLRKKIQHAALYICLTFFIYISCVAGFIGFSESFDNNDTSLNNWINRTPTDGYIIVDSNFRSATNVNGAGIYQTFTNLSMDKDFNISITARNSNLDGLNYEAIFFMDNTDFSGDYIFISLNEDYYSNGYLLSRMYASTACSDEVASNHLYQHDGFTGYNHTFSINKLENGTFLFFMDGVFNYSYNTACNISNFKIMLFSRSHNSFIEDFMIDYPYYPVINVITLVSPLDQLISNQKLIVEYNITKDTNCSIYINGQINQTDAAVENGTTQTFNISDMDNDGAYQYYISCGDAVSENRTYFYHAGSPIINIISPVNLSSQINNDTLILEGFVTDLNLLEVNQTIKNSTNDILYMNLSGLLANGTTFYSLDNIINISIWENGTYTYLVTAVDNASNTAFKEIIFTKSVCVPSYSCLTFSACNLSNVSACNSVFDTNFCGIPFTGNNSDFDVSCVYIYPTPQPSKQLPASSLYVFTAISLTILTIAFWQGSLILYIISAVMFIGLGIQWEDSQYLFKYTLISFGIVLLYLTLWAKRE